MIEIDVNVPSKINFSKVKQMIEECCKLEGLRITLKGTLSKYPGCVHLHYKKGNNPGTLEITLWEKENRIWFSIQSRRRAEWINESVKKLKTSIEKELNKNREKKLFNSVFA